MSIATLVRCAWRGAKSVRPRALSGLRSSPPWRAPFSPGGSGSRSSSGGDPAGLERTKRSNDDDRSSAGDIGSAAVGSAGSPRAPMPPKRTTVANLQSMYRKGRPIVMLTAYDYPAAVQADLAQVDVVLVGDSLAMVELGHDTTQPVTMDEMLHHCRAVMRGARRPLVVGDMPFGSYEVSEEDTVRNASRFIKEAGVQAVKIEGGVRIARHVERVVRSGVAVMGHTGLTPASVSAIGHFRSFGRTAREAIAITEDGLALQDAGAFAVVLECVPERVARFVTDKLQIPTIGIGAGPCTSGQVMVYHDILGMLQHPHHAKVTPKFVKRYAEVAELMQRGINAYKEEVRSRAFPSKQHSPYEIPDSEWELLVSHFANSAHVLPPMDLVEPKGGRGTSGDATKREKRGRKPPPKNATASKTSRSPRRRNSDGDARPERRSTSRQQRPVVGKDEMEEEETVYGR